MAFSTHFSLTVYENTNKYQTPNAKDIIHLLIVAVVSGKVGTVRGSGGEVGGERGGVDGEAGTGGHWTVERERHMAPANVAWSMPEASAEEQK